MKKARLLKLVIVGAALVVMQLALVSTSMAAPPAKGDAWGGGRCYTVQAGDTLSDIAYKFNVATFYLAQVNHLRNPNWIFEGQQLCIPAGGPPFWHPSPVMYRCPSYPSCPPYPVYPPYHRPMPPYPMPYYGMGDQGDAMPYADDMMGQGQYAPYADPYSMDMGQGQYAPYANPYSMDMGQGQYMPYADDMMGQQMAPYAQVPFQPAPEYQDGSYYQ